MRNKMKVTTDRVVVSAIALILILAFPILSVHSAEKGPVKIGYLTPQSGPYAELGQYLREGLELYLKEINYKVAGRKIEVFYEDTKMDPRTGLVKAKRLVEEKKVHIVAGLMSSSVAYAIKDYLVSNKIIFVSTNAGADDLSQRDFSPYFFRSSFANCTTGHVLGDYLYNRKGYRKAIIMAADYSAGYEYVGGFCRVFIKNGGEIVEEFYWPLGTIDYAPYLAKISPDRADVVIFFGAGSDIAHLVTQFDEYGVKKKIPLVSLASISESLLPAIRGDAALGITDVYHYKTLLNLDTPEHKAFNKLYWDKYRKVNSVHVDQAYCAGKLIAKGLEAINGNVEDTNALIKAMEKVEFKAARGPFKLDKYHNPVNNHYVSVIKRKDGEYFYEIVKTYPTVSQFWPWSPEEFLKMPAYKNLKGTWVKKK